MLKSQRSILAQFRYDGFFFIRIETGQYRGDETIEYVQ